MAVVAPSGPAVEERLAAEPDILRAWDLDPVVAPHALDRHDADTGTLTPDAPALV